MMKLAERQLRIGSESRFIKTIVSKQMCPSLEGMDRIHMSVTNALQRETHMEHKLEDVLIAHACQGLASWNVRGFPRRLGLAISE